MRTSSWPQLLLIGTFIPFCWLAMQAVHELGHVAGALITGGTVRHVELNPLTVSRTDLAENPNPLVVAWLGPLIGVMLPLVVLGMLRVGRIPGWYLARFFAGFCLIANGVYIGVGSFERIGDAGDLIRHGSPIWSLWLFGLLAISLGFLLWHGLGPHFGLGKAGVEIHPHTAYASCGMLAFILLIDAANSLIW